ncbi:MAG: hypothetical protein KAQ98_10200 [Bacteriovoracaceae bacterium]|nr:hypothetical protein [Bacteriovoracaceae bacterium]
MESLEIILLKILSFYEPLTIEKILLEIDSDEISSMPHLTMEDLEQVLLKMKKQGRLKCRGKGRDRSWLRINPGRISWWRRIFYRLT